MRKSKQQINTNVESRIMEILILLRKIERINSSEFAEKIGISKSSLLKIESGHSGITLDIMRNYARGLSIPFSLIAKYAEICEDEISKNGTLDNSTIRGSLYHFLKFEAEQRSNTNIADL